MYTKRQFLKNLGSAKTLKAYANLKKQAATLVPIINIENQGPSILFMTRPENISYGGQICFPGGKFDEKTDKNVTDTALRETFEEVAIDPRNVDVWGQLPGVPDRWGEMLVNPIVGEVVVTESDDDLASDISSQNIQNLLKNGIDPNFKKLVNNDEVDQIFTVKISDLLDEKNIKLKEYTSRGKQPGTTWTMPIYKIKESKTKIWGLTAIQLNMALHYICGQEMLTSNKS